MLKKIGSIVLILVFCLQVVAGSGVVVYGTNGTLDPNTIPSGDALLVVGYDISKTENIDENTIYKEERFILKNVTLFNRIIPSGSNDAIKIKKIMIEQNPSFLIKNGSIDKGEIIKKDESRSVSVGIGPITYAGGANGLPIVIVYSEVKLGEDGKPTRDDQGKDIESEQKAFRTNLNINTGGERPAKEIPERKPGTPLLQVEAGRMAEGKAGEEVTV
ncbi:MAG: hypothetical protein GX962_03475, partial [Epulopiscium sp.]|nr:hypothetical protein [Candidatus Epulonipiscium sp.]